MGNKPKPQKGFLSTIFKRKAPLPVQLIRGTVLGTVLAYGALSIGPEFIPGRPMTDDEISHFNDFYGDSIDLSKVKLHHSKLGDARLKSGDAIAQAMNNVLIVKKDVYDGIDTNREKYIIAHELGHIWQHANNPTSLLEAIWQVTKNTLSGNPDLYKLYEYRLEPGKKFEEYGIEQQASILADYYGLEKLKMWPETLVRGDPYIYTDTDDYVDKLKSQYREVLTGVIPLKPEQTPATTNGNAPTPATAVPSV